MTIHLIRYCIKKFPDVTDRLRNRQDISSTDFLMERNCIFQVLTMKEQVLPAHIRKAKIYNFMIPFVDVVYDGDDYEFEISLELKDPCCFGFKVVYHNGSFLLLQNIESIDIPCVPGMEYIENDEELYDREPFTVEVGNTEDIDKIADILRELGDHYLEEDVASIPLSLTAYMKVTSFNPVVYEVCYMDKEIKQRTVEEEKLRKEVVQELLIYQG